MAATNRKCLLALFVFVYVLQSFIVAEYCAKFAVRVQNALMERISRVYRFGKSFSFIFPSVFKDTAWVGFKKTKAFFKVTIKTRKGVFSPNNRIPLKVKKGLVASEIFFAVKFSDMYSFIGLNEIVTDKFIDIPFSIFIVIIQI